MIRHTHHLPAREEEGILSVKWVLLLLVLAYFKRIPNDWLPQTLTVEQLLSFNEQSLITGDFIGNLAEKVS